MPSIEECDIFLSYTAGLYKPAVSIFSKALIDQLEHSVADWKRQPHESGKLWDKLQDQMEQCRVFILFMTSDYETRMAGDELEWLIERCISDPVWAESRLIIPVLLDPTGAVIWKKREEQFPDRMQGIVRQEFFNSQGRCDLTTKNDDELVLDPVHASTIERLKADIRAHLAKPPVQLDEGSEEPSENMATGGGLPRVFIFGGAEWPMTGESIEIRDHLLSTARNGLTPDQNDRLIDVGDEWAEYRRLTKNAPLFAGGGDAHAVVVGDRELLDVFAEEGVTDEAGYAAHMKRKIDENLSLRRGWRVKTHSLWLPDLVSPEPLDLDSTNDLGEFVIDSGSTDGMAALIKGLLAGSTTANILYQNPGQQFEDIAVWARTRFAEQVQLNHAQVDTFRDHEVLRQQISGILNDGDDSIILIAGDGAIDASNRGRRDTHNLFQSRLYNVETALRDALREVGFDERKDPAPRFGRIFLQYRNPMHTFGELTPKPEDPTATWVPVRFDAAHQPCNDCMQNVREVINRVCG